jgi:hypothetical protein
VQSSNYYPTELYLLNDGKLLDPALTSLTK